MQYFEKRWSINLLRKLTFQSDKIYVKKTIRLTVIVRCGIHEWKSFLEICGEDKTYSR